MIFYVLIFSIQGSVPKFRGCS